MTKRVLKSSKKGALVHRFMIEMIRARMKSRVRLMCNSLIMGNESLIRRRQQIRIFQSTLAGMCNNRIWLGCTLRISLQLIILIVWTLLETRERPRALIIIRPKNQVFSKILHLIPIKRIRQKQELAQIWNSNLDFIRKLRSLPQSLMCIKRLQKLSLKRKMSLDWSRLLLN